MSKQLIFCVEADKRSRSDWVYIEDTIKRFYKEDNEIKKRPVFMGSKTNYNSREVVKQVRNWIKDYTIGESQVFYCIDVDDFESNPRHIKEFEDISNYCKKNDYTLIWFCHDIEDVYLCKRIHDKDKVQDAIAFRRKNGINLVDENKLKIQNCHSIHCSNILNVLNEHFNEKVE